MIDRLLDEIMKMLKYVLQKHMDTRGIITLKLRFFLYLNPSYPNFSDILTTILNK